MSCVRLEDGRCSGGLSSRALREEDSVVVVEEAEAAEGVGPIESRGSHSGRQGMTRLGA